MVEEVLALEEELSFESFSSEDAYEAGKLIVDRVKREGLKNVRIRVVLGNDIVFQYLMPGKNGVVWLDRKQSTVETVGHSSYYVWTAHEENGDFKEFEGDQTKVICGGGFPIIVYHEIVGSFMVSGLAHQEDHMLIVDALRELKNKK